MYNVCVYGERDGEKISIPSVYAGICSLTFSIMSILVSVGGSASGTLTGAGKRTSGVLHSKENHDSIKVEGINCSSIRAQKIVMLTVRASLLYHALGCSL